jgi:hypothetical protein
MPTIVFYGNGVQKRFEVPGNIGRTVWVGGVLTTPASFDFQSVTMTASPGSKVPVQIDYVEQLPNAAAAAGVVYRSAGSGTVTIPDAVTHMILAGTHLYVIAPTNPYDQQEILISIEGSGYTNLCLTNAAFAPLPVGLNMGAMPMVDSNFVRIRWSAGMARWYRTG